MGASQGRISLLLSLAAALAVFPTASFGGGTGVSWPGHYTGTPTVQVDSSKIFFRYRVPDQISSRAKRDLEFLWSPRYQQLGVPLNPNNGSENDLDRLGKAIADIPPKNPFGFPLTDIQLVFDYLNFANATYNPSPDPVSGPGFVLAGFANYDTLNRSHVDTYLWLYGPNGDDPAGVFRGRGHTPSDFTSANEDVSTGRDSSLDAVLVGNSLSFTGPATSEVGVTDSTRWTKPDGRANAVFDHEFQHMFNFLNGQYQPSPGAPSEIFSSAAEALGGEAPSPPQL